MKGKGNNMLRKAREKMERSDGRNIVRRGWAEVVSRKGVSGEGGWDVIVHKYKRDMREQSNKEEQKHYSNSVF